jgi:hypothetical protein
MNRVAIILIALSTLAIALMLGWDRYAEWRITQDPGYRASNVDLRVEGRTRDADWQRCSPAGRRTAAHLLGWRRGRRDLPQQ